MRAAMLTPAPSPPPAAPAPPPPPLPTSLLSLTYGDIVLDLVSWQATRAGVRLHLPGKLFRLLAFFVTNHDRLITRPAIWEGVWGNERPYTDSSNVIDVYVSMLRQRLRISLPPSTPRPELIQTIVSEGYYFSSTPH